MAKIYYKSPLENEFSQLSYKDFGAAPRFHMHQGDSIGIVPASQGGLFDNSNNTMTELKLFSGPILYNKNNQLNQEYTLTEGVYFANAKNDSYIQIGMPGWEHGAIPYATEHEQLENMYRQLPIGSTLMIPRANCAGVLSKDGLSFICSLNIYYLIPPNTKKITLSGSYVIRQNGCYLFTSGNNYFTQGFAVPFQDKPSMISTPQTIKNTVTSAYNIDWTVTNGQYYGSNVKAIRMVTTAEDINASQTNTHTYAYWDTETGQTVTKSVRGIAGQPGVVRFYNLKLTFSDKE